MAGRPRTVVPAAGTSVPWPLHPAATSLRSTAGAVLRAATAFAAAVCARAFLPSVAASLAAAATSLSSTSPSVDHPVAASTAARSDRSSLQHRSQIAAETVRIPASRGSAQRVPRRRTPRAAPPARPQTKRTGRRRRLPASMRSTSSSGFGGPGRAGSVLSHSQSFPFWDGVAIGYA